MTFSGSGVVSPQLLEAMSDDFGADPDGFYANFAYGQLSLGSNAWVQLVSQSQNAGSGGPNAVYANSITVPFGATLDLNGLNLYTYSANIDGTVLNGSVNIVLPQFHPPGLITPASPLGTAALKS